MAYELSDAEYGANEVEDTWVQSLLGRLGAYLTTLQPLLTPANFEQLVSHLLEKVRQLVLRTLITLCVLSPIPYACNPPASCTEMQQPATVTDQMLCFTFALMHTCR